MKYARKMELEDLVYAIAEAEGVDGGELFNVVDGYLQQFLDEHEDDEIDPVKVAECEHDFEGGICKKCGWGEES